MNFSTAVSTCLSKFATFSGRATRSEFWWFYLFTVLLGWGATIVGALVLDGGAFLGNLVSLIFLIPTFAAGSRRLHDIGRSGWWQLLVITVIGVLLLIFWFASDSEKAANKYGEYTP
ncbi:DUF805 domain-containing protein [Zwartia panacis]|uniref:DUF805 domain-containing protein n=1 Tax=Zwartia panacis TaxID=2683345 RepID=UPI0025B474E7|nr:DUF805 domain-containing protein [Zwartia panacis]MDN4017295.1 DUF805 domain-containing protein [Zwartia panacis]